MRKSLFFVVVSIALLALAGCGPSEPAFKVDLSKKEQVVKKTETGVITYAYLPQYSHMVSYRRHRLLLEYLRRQTGLNLKQVFPDTFDQHLEMVGRGQIDISFTNPFIYITLAHRYDSQAFVSAVEEQGKKKFRGQIICRADNTAINRVEDCRGKRWIAVDPKSAGGYLYPLGFFINHGIRPQDFAEIAFAPGPGGKQEKVVLAVYAGKYDIGSIREGTLAVVADKIDTDDIRVIAATPWYPGWVYSARAGLDRQVVAKIKEALLKLDYAKKEDRHILEAAKIYGFSSAADRDYDPVRILAAQIDINLDE